MAIKMDVPDGIAAKLTDGVVDGADVRRSRHGKPAQISETAQRTAVRNQVSGRQVLGVAVEGLGQRHVHHAVLAGDGIKPVRSEYRTHRDGFIEF